jgi:D-alanyl-D-alanine carboxypeptidase
MQRSMLVAVLLAVAATVACAGSDRQARPDLQRVVDGLVSGGDRIAPGAVGYVSGPRGTWVGAAGVADVRTGARMSEDTRVRLESVSKLWVATVIVRLAGEGKLRLDDTVERWLPGLLPAGSRITLRQLLNHTSGLVDTNDITHDPASYLSRVKDQALRSRLLSIGRHVDEDPGYVFPPSVWVDFAAALPLESEPGAMFHYSNIGYIVAGLVAERAGGADLATLTRRWITEPLHLKSAAYDPSPRISGSHAQGYMVGEGGRLTDTTTWTLGLGANGGIVSDAADEARFLQAVMGGKLLTKRQLAQVVRVPFYSSYGLGIGSVESGCAGLVWGHNGGGDGFETNVLVSRDGKRVAVLLLNGRTADNSGDRAAFVAVQNLFCAA